MSFLWRTVPSALRKWPKEHVNNSSKMPCLLERETESIVHACARVSVCVRASVSVCVCVCACVRACVCGGGMCVCERERE